MALYLNEHEVDSLLTMPEAIAALRDSFLALSRGEAINQPRRRLYLPNGAYHTMAAADLSLQTFGQKAYTSFPPKAKFLFLLYDALTGGLLALMEADKLGQVRTGAASGLAASCLARPDSGIHVGIYGAGWQAQSQLEAVCAVRDVAQITVYSRNAANREVFCSEMSQRLNVLVIPAARPEEAAMECQIVITATNAREPVLNGDWLSPGAHVNVAGSNMLMKREIDEKVVARCGLIVVDSIEQSRIEAGDLLPAYERRLFRWEQVRELHEIVAGTRSGRTGADEITLFKSNGIALEDVGVATLVYRKAIEQNVGLQIPLWAS
jgi:ornithine cyclodeaminase/alanine dehydrogenase-like protein (mu-crystallin family)